MLQLQGYKIKKIEIVDEEKTIYVHIKPDGRSKKKFCPICGRECAGYDRGTEERKWRADDYNGYKTFLVMDLPRIQCPEHGIHRMEVSFAFHGSGFTKKFVQEIVFDALQMSKKAVSKKYRIDWRTVGRLMSLVLNIKEPDLKKRLENVTEIGIDETSYRKGHKYITVVIDLKTNTVLYAAVGHDFDALAPFFESLTKEQREKIKFASGDAAKWIKKCVKAYCPNATFCLDPFHVMQWAVEAMDQCRREVWRSLLGAERMFIKHAKYPLGKNLNPEDQTQVDKLQEIKVCYPKLFKAWQLKTLLGSAFHADTFEDRVAGLNAFLSWACRCRLQPMVELSKTIRRHKDDIINTMRYGRTSSQVEAINNHIKLLIRRSYGFSNVQNMIDMILLVCSETGRSLKPVYEYDLDFESIPLRRRSITR